METIFLLQVNHYDRKTCHVITEIGDKSDIIPRLSLAIEQGVQAGDGAMIETFEILVSVVETVRHNLPGIKGTVTEKNFKL